MSLSGLANAQIKRHSHLSDIIDCYQTNQYLKPISPKQSEIFDCLCNLVDLSAAKILVDSICGTASSTCHFAKVHPDKWVIGIDKSVTRLRKNPLFKTHQVTDAIAIKDNCILLQANVIDMWRLMARHGIRVQKHTLLYPNPYPKSKHLKLRWYAHPIVTTLLDLSDELLIRSNWLLYLEEFSLVMKYAGYQPEPISLVPIDHPLTRFEEKYHARHEPLHQLILRRHERGSIDLNTDSN